MTSRRPIVVVVLIALTASFAACGCPTGIDPIPEKLAVLVIDNATGAAVDNPTFSENGNPVLAACATPVDGGACPTWLLSLVGSHTILVAAPGYTSNSASFDTGIGSTYCGQTRPARQIQLIVHLAKL